MMDFKENYYCDKVFTALQGKFTIAAVCQNILFILKDRNCSLKWTSRESISDTAGMTVPACRGRADCRLQQTRSMALMFCFWYPDLGLWNRNVPEQSCHELEEIVSCRRTNRRSLQCWKCRVLRLENSHVLLDQLRSSAECWKSWNKEIYEI